ncbi:P-loop ATPase, Sll1717 family [Streptomyces sp. NPDC088755]|uniref:P-loop ATPase, Sll1717 family n=1 Tax=Streptomyces sp. NPDC088755 TaxID=3365888 RepID=UPI0038125E7F
MPSRQDKYRHICDRTFLRPRDIIKFCNEILKQHKIIGSGNRFDNEAIHEARAGYSDYLLNELDDEIAKHVPQYKEYLEVVKELGSLSFTLENFSSAWSRRSSLSEIEPISGLAQLFEFSVVGYLKPGGRGGGS